VNELPIETSENECPRAAIAAYIDGELAASEELALEMHFVGCSICAAELESAKTILRALDFALEDENEIELPADFTKTIVANAESRVSGLRRPNERFTALFICAALFLLVIAGLGRETETVLLSSGKIVDRTFRRRRLFYASDLRRCYRNDRRFAIFVRSIDFQIRACSGFYFVCFRGFGSRFFRGDVSFQTLVKFFGALNKVQYSIGLNDNFSRHKFPLWQMLGGLIDFRLPFNFFRANTNFHA
jgi:hypothetical protein